MSAGAGALRPAAVLLPAEVALRRSAYSQTAASPTKGNPISALYRTEPRLSAAGFEPASSELSQLADIAMDLIESQEENASREAAFVVENAGTPQVGLCLGKLLRSVTTPPRLSTMRLRGSETRAGRCWPTNAPGRFGRDRPDRRYARPAAPFLAALTLAACTTPGKPNVVYQDVAKPVSVSCVPRSADLTPPKVHTDAELKAMDGPSRYLAIASDRLALLAWKVTVEPVMKGCE